MPRHVKCCGTCIVPPPPIHPHSCIKFGAGHQGLWLPAVVVEMLFDWVPFGRAVAHTVRKPDGQHRRGPVFGWNAQCGSQFGLVLCPAVGEYARQAQTLWPPAACSVWPG